MGGCVPQKLHNAQIANIRGRFPVWRCGIVEGGKLQQVAERKDFHNIPHSKCVRIFTDQVLTVRVFPFVLDSLQYIRLARKTSLQLNSRPRRCSLRYHLTGAL